MDTFVAKYYQIPRFIRVIYVIAALLTLTLPDLSFLGQMVGSTIYAVLVFSLELMIFTALYQKLGFNQLQTETAE